MAAGGHFGKKKNTSDFCSKTCFRQWSFSRAAFVGYEYSQTYVFSRQFKRANPAVSPNQARVNVMVFCFGHLSVYKRQHFVKNWDCSGLEWCLYHTNVVWHENWRQSSSLFVLIHVIDTSRPKTMARVPCLPYSRKVTTGNSPVGNPRKSHNIDWIHRLQGNRWLSTKFILTKYTTAT